jgi:hypothetical protein
VKNYAAPGRRAPSSLSQGGFRISADLGQRRPGLKVLCGKEMGNERDKTEKPALSQRQISEKLAKN